MKRIILTIAAVLTLMSCTPEDTVNENSIYAKVTSKSAWVFPTKKDSGLRFKYNSNNELVMNFVDLDTIQGCYRTTGEYRGYYMTEDEFYVLWNDTELYYTMDNSILRMKVQNASAYYEANETPICN